MFFSDVKTGSKVRFNLANVICPDMENLIERITNRLGLTGQVVMLSDSGPKRDFYAVVQVGGIMTPLIIPVTDLEMCDGLLEKEKLGEGRV